MKTLVLDSLPIDIHAFKGQAPDAATIIGVKVFATNFITALIKYGSFDRYCFLKSVAGRHAPPIAGLQEHNHRLWCLDASNLDSLRTLTRPILAGPGPLLKDLRLLRRHYAPRRDWPVTGFIHAVSGRMPPALALDLLLDEVRPWDVLICSSNAGRKVLDAYMEDLVNAYPGLVGIRELPRIGLCVIPLGTELLIDDEGRRAQTRQRLGLGADDVGVLYVGRLAPTTKCDLLPLLAAFASIDGPLRASARLIIAGDDTRHRMAEGLRAAAEKLGIGGSTIVHANPTHDEKEDLYRAADVFVSPSDNVQETFGLTIIEALSAGLPVVASDWDGYRDLVVDGETGFLVPTFWTQLGPSFDELSLWSPVIDNGILSGATIVDISHLTRSLETLIRDADRRRLMGSNARRAFLAQFHWPVVIKRYEALWEELQARAEREADSYDNSPNPARGVVRRTFGHYPSDMMGDDCQVVLGPLADRVETLLALAEGLPTPSIPGLRGLTQRVVGELAAAGRCSIGELVSMAGADAPDVTSRLVVARLLKHGVLRPAGEVRRQDA
jgi:D-inositol-3-phosphate glycosyltransferase